MIAEPGTVWPFVRAKDGAGKETQEDRRARMCRLAAREARRWFTAAGEWRPASPRPGARECLWLCVGLLQEDAELANAILEKTPFSDHGQFAALERRPAPGAPFDIFVTNQAIQLLTLFGPRLAPGVRARLEEWARVGLNDCPGNRQADHQFKGHNDNMPAEATMGLILGGRYFGDDEAVSRGLWNLRQLADLLARRGALSEFNSPTYSPATLAALTEIAECGAEGEIRDLAGKCVERVWAELLAHFHPPTGNLAGPYSRAYTTDTLGHLGNATYLLWQVLGDAVRPNPVSELEREMPRLVIHHHGDRFFAVAHFSWFTAQSYHPPRHLLDWLAARNYPFRSRMTAERGEGASWWGRDKWAAGEVTLCNYQEDDFAVGSSDGDWGGQAEEFVVRYRRAVPAEGVADLRSLYVRYLVDDDGPGKLVADAAGLFEGEADTVPDHGRYRIVQDDGIVLLSVSPHPLLAGRLLSRLRFCLVIPEHLSEAARVEASDGHVWIEDGPFRMALRPLGVACWSGGDTLRLEKEGPYRLVSLYNHEGEARAFTADELSRTLNGFVAVTGCASDGSFEAFRARVLEGELLDYQFHESRTVRYRLGRKILGLSYGLRSQGVRYATLNGRCVPRPVWEAAGLPAGRLPFLGETHDENGLAAPWSHLALHEDPESPWAIFSSGRREGRRAFTLVEILVVVGILAVLAALSIPALSALGGSQALSKAAGDMAGTLERARAYAMANNTYVYVGFCESNAASVGPPVGRVYVGVAASRDGTSGYAAGTWDASNLVEIARLQRFDRVHLIGKSIAGTLTNMDQNASGNLDITLPSRTPFSSPVGSGRPTCSFSQVVRFAPSGGATIVTNLAAAATVPPYIQAGIVPVHGDVADANSKNLGGIQIDGVTGAVALFRP